MNKNNGTDMRNIYIRLAGFFKQYLGIFLLAVVCMVFASAFESISLGMIIPLVDNILNDGQIILAQGVNIPLFLQQIIDTINLMPRQILLRNFIIVLMLMFLSKEFFLFGQRYLMTTFSLRTVRDIKNKIYKKLLSLSLDFYHRNKTGNLISRIISDASLVQSSLSEGMVELIYQPIQLIMHFIVIISIRNMFSIPWSFILVLIILLPLITYPVAMLSKRLRKITHERQKQVAGINSLLIEGLSGINVVKAFSMEKYEEDRFVNENQNFYKICMRSMKRIIMINPITEFSGLLCLVIILWFGGKEVINGKISTGAFVAFLAALLSLIKPFKKLSKVYTINQQGLAAASRVFEMLDETPTIRDREKPITLGQLREKISFRNVSFGYNPKEKIVIRYISLDINVGEIVAFVGPSGVGKTTLVNLVPRFYDPTEGKIKIDGHDLRDVSLVSLRRQIGLVTQETVLFNDTIFNNIAYGRSDIDKSKVIEAAKNANAHDFIMQMQNGYDTIAGERGVRLSGGQRQRLSIARALLKNPPILILDEATSHLDTESEHLVQTAIERLMKNRTVLVIAHRLSTIKNADKIVVMGDNGVIVGVGSHTQLLEENELYNKLYNMQIKEQRDE